MSVWNPTHSQFTVLRARNIIAKGKAGNNDVFVTIQLGKEKYQTSTIKNARNPEWFEECDLPIPHLHSEIEVSVFHRGVLSDDFLGYAAIPLWEQKIQDKPKTQWVPLKNKPSKGVDNKYRGEIEVKVTFHCHSRVDFTSGLKKRSSSIRNLATAVGDKLKFNRSKSFRENRKDPEGGGKSDRNQNHNGSLQDVPEEGLTRSYSMSAAYVKTMSLDRGNVLQFANNGGEAEAGQDLKSKSLYNIAGNRHSMVELPSSQPPPPYQVRPSSQDDLHLGRPSSGPRPHPRLPVSSASYLDSVLRRDQARYESIRERTEPESSSSDNERQPARRPRPPPRGIRTRPRPFSEEVNVDPRDLRALASLTSSQGANSRGGTPVSMEGGEGQFVEFQRSEMMTNGSLQFDRSGLLSSQRKKSDNSGQLLVNGDVKLRKRAKRERLKMYRQAGRRFTVQGLESRLSGLYDDSMSDPSDSSRTEIPDDLFGVYKNMSKEELLRVVIQNKAQLIRKDQYIKDLECYIDNLLVRVMEMQPRILHRPPLHHR
ncbi:rab11 family-interacting protein 2-like isoform X2 [Littorina saxatilis]|uniref:rab11 family-interacting protein 2-like isoform X2 n=1 Tax=Littorina saxatilis TaxID=31220 RepID=UPI0038B5B4A3